MRINACAVLCLVIELLAVGASADKASDPLRSVNELDDLVSFFYLQKNPEDVARIIDLLEGGRATSLRAMFSLGTPQ
jgi:hypothetical protein